MSDLWGSGNMVSGIAPVGPKSIYDPCPAGWRVPGQVGYVTVWNGITKESVTWVYNAENTKVVGCSWDGAGFMPFTGTWYPSGVLMRASTSINTWTGTLNSNGFALSSRISKKPLSNEFEDGQGGFSTGQVGGHPVHGYPVRCIKE